MQLGNGTNVTPLIPVLVGGGLQFVQIATGDSHSCGLTAAGAAYCWGQNVYGQLGDGTTVSRGVPTPVAGGLVFTSLTAGTLHSCGLVADGSAYCWGLGEAGNLGASPTETCVDGAGPRGCNRSPMAVTGGFRFSAITAANSHTCALDAAGVAYCWGGNEGGELGDGISGLGVLRVTPAPVSSAERFVRISAGGSITCALNAAGKGFCWGRQSLGGLGDGTITTRNVPTAVAGGHSFSTIEAPATFLGATCGATTAGTPLCWAGDRGQAGTGTVPGPRVPTPVKLPE
jgi:alpha-tubulin suppressor-like RCC1 family protein